MENDMAISKIKLKIGTVYQKETNGIYYFRYQVNGSRKAISLKTRNKQQAIKEAEKYVPLIQATSSEVIAAHVNDNFIPPNRKLDINCLPRYPLFLSFKHFFHQLVYSFFIVQQGRSKQCLFEQ